MFEPPRHNRASDCLHCAGDTIDQIVSRQDLEHHACACYYQLKTYLQRLFGSGRWLSGTGWPVGTASPKQALLS